MPVFTVTYTVHALSGIQCSTFMTSWGLAVFAALAAIIDDLGVALSCNGSGSIFLPCGSLFNGRSNISGYGAGAWGSEGGV